ncbi:MAG: oxidoreductase [Citrobacter freundii]|nr:MAG: oxidoreductase [Citrobacter freundii]
MKAIILNKPGGVENFVYSEIDQPQIQHDEVLVQVKAISINPVDVKVRAGHGIYQVLKNEQPVIPGWDISGIITKAGSATPFKAGDEVFGMVRFPGHGKAYAEYVAVPAHQLALKPPVISHEEAAAATLAALTAYQALVIHATVKEKQRLLIHAAAGGVGHFAVQMAKRLGAHVTGTSSVNNKPFVMSLGADEHIDYHHYDWNNNPEQFDFVLDTVGDENIEKSLKVVKAGGTVISIPSRLSEQVSEQAKAKNVNALFFLVASNGGHTKVIADWLQQGFVKPYISAKFSFDEMGKAHEQVESGRTVGKVVVLV